MSSLANASSTSATRTQPVRPSLRPLALPTEHGGWGFLFEPIVLGLALAPSRAGALVALSFCLGFLTRQPLKLALQDLLRGKSYARTGWCWSFAAAYALTGGLALGLAISMTGWPLIIPIGLVVPLGLMQIAYDASNRSRVLLPELGGAVAMSSSAAAIAIAGGMRILPALTLAAIIIARSIPSIIYVRALLQKKKGRAYSHATVVAVHAIALFVVALLAPRLAVAAFVLLLIRALFGLIREVPAAKTIGWQEVVWGAMTIGFIIAAWRL